MEFSDRFVSYEGFTFDDVLLEPRYSEVIPSQVCVKSFFTNQIELNIPICSAAMDTVTDGRLAIAIAREGGIGVIHRNMTPEAQAEEVDKAKRSESGVIVDPFYLHPDDTLRDAVALMEHYHISGVPIVDADMKLVGIITNRDLRFITDYDQPIRDVMTKENLIVSSVGTTLEDAKAILMKHKVEKLPIVDNEGHLKGLITIKDIIKAKEFPNAAKDPRGRLRVAAAIGVGADALSRADQLVAAGVDAIVVDTAHGHSKLVLDTIRKLKEKYGDLPIVGGNIATEEGARALIDAGADAVKVGVGPGSICTTRVIAGIGVPQIAAIMNAAKVAKPRGSRS